MNISVVLNAEEVLKKKSLVIDLAFNVLDMFRDVGYHVLHHQYA